MYLPKIYINLSRVDQAGFFLAFKKVSHLLRKIKKKKKLINEICQEEFIKYSPNYSISFLGFSLQKLLYMNAIFLSNKHKHQFIYF